eukprot:1175351-Prorocentrum_minimum.AAC.3
MIHTKVQEESITNKPMGSGAKIQTTAVRNASATVYCLQGTIKLLAPCGSLTTAAWTAWPRSRLSEGEDLVIRVCDRFGAERLFYPMH